MEYIFLSHLLLSYWLVGYFHLFIVATGCPSEGCSQRQHAKSAQNLLFNRWWACCRWSFSDWCPPTIIPRLENVLILWKHCFNSMESWHFPIFDGLKEEWNKNLWSVFFFFTSLQGEKFCNSNNFKILQI